MAGPTGASEGLSGETWRSFALAWCCAMAVTVLVISITVLGRLQESPSEVAATFVDELSSATTLAFAFVLPGGVVLWMRRARPTVLASVAVLAVGLAAFAAVHIGGCFALRVLLYPGLVGQTYGLDLTSREMPFEVAKDLIAYGASAIGFAVILAWRRASPQVAEPSPGPVVTFDIQDGPRMVRASVADILAVRSAGNYAEFQLSDGRRPLMRISLSGLQDVLEPQGFVRTHRSWLVNAGRVTGLRPEGSGDYAIELGAIEAPLSRRFPTALAALRG